MREDGIVFSRLVFKYAFMKTIIQKYIIYITLPVIRLKKINETYE